MKKQILTEKEKKYLKGNSPKPNNKEEIRMKKKTGGQMTMTNRIIDFILRNELRAAQERLEKLIQTEAPKIMIQGQQKIVEELAKGKIKVGGDQELLNCTYETFKTKKGNGGKIYVEFDNGIKYFPNAKYGRFITR